MSDFRWIKVYVYKNKRGILMKSSSGGAFWGIAETFFKAGGVLAMERNLILTLECCTEKQKI